MTSSKANPKTSSSSKAKGQGPGKGKQRQFRKKGPLDPPGEITTTLSQSLAKKHIVPQVPPIGIERRFQRRPTVLEGGLDEALEVGVLRYPMGQGVVSVSVELDTELYVGANQACQIQVFGPTVSDRHLRLYAVRTSTALAIVCMNDISSQTGYILNGRHFPPRSVRLGAQKVSSRMIVLKDGDTLQVPNTPQIMTYKHNNEHFPVQANISALIDDYSLFRTTSSNHYIDTQFWRIHNYPLGDGNFGVVNLGTHKTGGIQVAIKTIDSRTSSGQTWRERLNHEVGNVRSLNHPNIMKWLDQIKESGRAASEDEERDGNEQGWDWGSEGIWKAHLVFELATGGDLFSYLEYKESISEDETKFITWQLVKGIDHIHSHDIAHRDIKLENILLYTRKSFPRVLIGDFGLSVTLASVIQSVPPGQAPAVRETQLQGTLSCQPPERLKAFSKVVKTGGLGESLGGANRNVGIGEQWFEEEKQLDIWGLGVVVYYLIAMKHPYEGLSTGSGPGGRLSASRSRTATSNRFRSSLDTETSPDQGASSADQVKDKKRKFLELLEEIEEEDEEEEEKARYASSNGPKGWDEYRKIHGQSTLGSSVSKELRIASRAYEDIRVFKDIPPEEWEPREKWKVVSVNCEKIIASLLSYRPHNRPTMAAALQHPWFTTSMRELEEEYERVVLQAK